MYTRSSKMAAKKEYKLDLTTVLAALDRQNLDFYAKLSDDDKKSYVPLVLMRYMSSLTDQNQNAAYAILATNDLVNIGFWNLSKHPELQHLLLCLTGLGKKQYRTWLPTKKSKRSNKVHNWVGEQFPHFNDQEIELFISKFDKDSWKLYLESYGLDDKELKELVEAWKKAQS